MIVARPADPDVKAAPGLYALGRERHERRPARFPRRRLAVIGRDPQHRVGLGAFNETLGLEAPGIVLGIAAAEARARRKARHPAAELRDARGARARADRNAGEARRRVEV